MIRDVESLNGVVKILEGYLDYASNMINFNQQESELASKKNWMAYQPKMVVKNESEE
ncbi:19086_t:CDS:2, partial [Gigaspora rosea]